MPAQAAGNDCPSASGPNGKVFGKRFGKLLGAAGIAALTGRKASARAAADAAGRDVVDTARENAVAQATAAPCNADDDDADARSAKSAKRAASRKEPAQTAYARPGLMPVSAEVMAKKDAFDAFGRVSCSSCEGGYSFESWANQYFYSETRHEQNGWANKLAKMEPGQELNWQGSENYGTIVMRANERIGGFDCKTYGWTIEKGASSAQRDGLLCWGKASDFSASDSWVEVY